MQLEINTWKHTVLSSKRRVGVAASAIASENIGHIDVVLRTNETETDLHQLAVKRRSLNPQYISTFIREKNTDKEFIAENLQWLPVEHVVSDYRAKKVAALEFVHSFWPETRPSYLRTAKGFFHIGKGTKPDFLDVQSDMIEESKQVMINKRMTNPRIEHSSTRTETIQAELETLQNRKQEISDENNQLKINRITMSVEIEALQKKQDEVSLQLESLKNQISSSSSEEEIEDILIKATELNRQYEDLDDGLIVKKSNLVALQEKIISNSSEIDSLGKQITRLENDLTRASVTRGKNPDYSITISTDKNENFLDMDAILAEMENQRKNARYYLLSTNCAVSAKKCILAGITDNFKEKLYEAGVSDSFFKIGFIETPISVTKWANKLQDYMMKFRFEASDKVVQQVRLTA